MITKKKVLFISSLILMVLMGIYGCGPSEKEEAGVDGEDKVEIAVIPKGVTHEFWKSVHAGAVKAGLEFNVEILWKGPQKEDDRAQQITVVEDFISRGVDGIVLAPLDDRALMRPVMDAARENIPIVIIDSALQGSDYICFVATDNFKGGAMAAERMGELLEGEGRIFLIRYQEGSASTTNREKGFKQTIQDHYPGIEYLAEDQYAGTTTESAYQLTENLLSRFPDVDGIFCPNESTTFGTLRALQEAGLAGKIKFVGFDSSPKLVQGLKDGEIHGLILQDPLNMGYLGVKQMILHLRGKEIEKRVDTGVYLITKENMDEPHSRQLLEPEFSRYLSWIIHEPRLFQLQGVGE
ncbi:MAG: substrate-binding domain-containing protein [Candidatus Aminicenantes bacterium]|nr:substrate-binding domain-containing protein [Candidatus Aminicenantes bacterium]